MGSAKNFITLKYRVVCSRRQPHRRLQCADKETYQYLWPIIFTRRLPGALPLCRWASRQGCEVRALLRLGMKEPGRCCLISRGTLRPGAVLVSIPRGLCLDFSGQDNRPHWCSQCCDGQLGAISVLTRSLVRHLHDPQSSIRHYVEFLYDFHNQSEDHVDVEPCLQRRLDELYAGNVLNAKGVANAPFLSRADITSPILRVELGRLHGLLREIQQSVPHFAASSVPWAMSMALSRSMVIPGSKFLSMIPLIDFAGHSSTPNALVRQTLLSHKAEASHCIQLVASREIKKGEAVTVMYSPRPSTSPCDKEYWKLFRGFIPT